MSLEEAIQEATNKYIPPGYKPEDYLICGKLIPLRIARLIVREVKYIMELDHEDELHLF